MTTRDFIANKFGVPSERQRQCSSVFADKLGNIYSYGYHYPLLFKVGGLTFRNTRGYSNTTAKHIGWCYGFDAVDVELSGCNQYSWRNGDQANRVPFMLYTKVHYDGVSDRDILRAILADLVSQRNTLADAMASKKRKDTQVYEWLQHDFDRCQAAIVRVEGAL